MERAPCVYACADKPAGALGMDTQTVIELLRMAEAGTKLLSGKLPGSTPARLVADLANVGAGVAAHLIEGGMPAESIVRALRRVRHHRADEINAKITELLKR